jgi:hypothetical protein
MFVAFACPKVSKTLSCLISIRSWSITCIWGQSNITSDQPIWSSNCKLELLQIVKLYTSVLTSHPKFAISKKEKSLICNISIMRKQTPNQPTMKLVKDILPFWHILPTHFSICVPWELEFFITVCPHSTRTQQRMIPAKPCNDEGSVYFQCAWNSWSILQPLNKGIRPTRPSIMIFCKPHVQMLLKNVIVVGPSCEIFDFC